MKNDLPKVYSPKDVEERVYKAWEESGCFIGKRDENKLPFTVVMPPPNVTGQLHMGHAMDSTLQDSLIRFKRMQGYSALWIPGTDHAGIATQIRVEETLRQEEGLTRYDLGREKFLQRVWAWKEKYGERIVEQQKKLGSSCDWTRSRFTMDEGCSRAVREVFVRLYNQGLIYKGKRIINWCPHCATALSDAEVEYHEESSKLWYIRYPLSDGSGYLVVATTRPETMMGDTGVAVNPKDKRYTELVGKTCILPLMGREIPIIADEYVETDFGTGCVKMTPAHDPNDYEVGKRHNLDFICVLDNNGMINSNGGKYAGIDRYACRDAVVKDLEALGLIERIDPYSHNVGLCYRCNNPVEPMISDQWFVKMKPLAVEAMRVVKDGEIRFIPERFSKIYLNWMENVHDWCISRQLWWGHQIPVWYCDDCGKLNVSRDNLSACLHCGSKNIHQDSDVLDTWFSSALWPFSILGWPDATPDLEYYYPTDVLVTGHDIIFFWVARMIFSACEQTHTVPFHTVVIHGLVRDNQGRKMSKSLGNGIDPLDMVDQYGADALRFNLITGNSPGNDMRFYTERCEAMRNFANKIWNASRFVLMNLTIDSYTLPKELELEDKWILSKLNRAILEITGNMERFDLGVAAQKVYDFIWGDYCDWYIELAKIRLHVSKEGSNIGVQNVLCYVLVELLKLLHPFMPFITEEIWQALPHDGDFLMLQSWPTYQEELNFPNAEKAMEQIMESIRAIRTRRNEMGVSPSKKAHLIVITDTPDIYQMGIPFFKRLAYASGIEIVEGIRQPSNIRFISIATSSAQLLIPMGELVDLEKERDRIERELKKTLTAIESLDKKLHNQKFLDKAPATVVEAEKERATKLRELHKNLLEQLSQIQG